MKIYQIMTIDIWNNITLIGFYKNLDDAIDDINGMIFEDSFKLESGDLQEYPSTFSTVFDTTVGDVFENKHPGLAESQALYDEEDYQLQIRGFILESDTVIEAINKITGGKENDN